MAWVIFNWRISSKHTVHPRRECWLRLDISHGNHVSWVRARDSVVAFLIDRHSAARTCQYSRRRRDDYRQPTLYCSDIRCISRKTRFRLSSFCQLFSRVFIVIIIIIIIIINVTSSSLSFFFLFFSFSFASFFFLLLLLVAFSFFFCAD